MIFGLGIGFLILVPSPAEDEPGPAFGPLVLSAIGLLYLIVARSWVRDPLRRSGRLSRWLVGPAFVWGVTTGLIAAVLVATSIVFPDVSFRDETVEANVAILFFFALPAVVIFFAILRGLGFLRLQYRSSTDVERSRILWIQTGFVALFTGLLLSGLTVFGGGAISADEGLPTLLGELVWQTGVLAMLGCFAFALFYHGALDASLVLQRTAVAGAMSVALTVIAVAMVEFLEGFVSERVPILSEAGSVPTAVVLALAFQPLRRRFSGVAKRYLGWLEDPDAGTPPGPAPAERA